MKTLDGAALAKLWTEGFKDGPSRRFILKCILAFLKGKPVEICLFGTTVGPKPYRQFPIRITAVIVTDSAKDMCVIEGKLDYSLRGGSKRWHGKRIKFVYNMYTRVATHVHSEE